MSKKILIEIHEEIKKMMSIYKGLNNCPESHLIQHLLYEHFKKQISEGWQVYEMHIESFENHMKNIIDAQNKGYKFRGPVQFNPIKNPRLEKGRL